MEIASPESSALRTPEVRTPIRKPHYKAPDSPSVKFTLDCQKHGFLSKDEIINKGEWPRTLLQRQRANVIPSLPSVFANLHEHETPSYFEEADGHKEELVNDIFPSFGSLRPLLLRGTPVKTPTNSSTPLLVGNMNTASTTPPSLSATRAIALMTSAASPGGESITSPVDSVKATVEPSFHRQASDESSLRVGIVCAAEWRSTPAGPVNVIAGMAAYLSAWAPGSKLIGFQGGPIGLLEGWCRELTPDDIAASVNQGTWELLSYGTCSVGGFRPADRAAEAARAMDVCAAERLDGLVVIAGPRDLSWAAAMSACFMESNCPTTVVGVPHSKNCSLYVPKFMALTLGFDSARRMISEILGTISIDIMSSDKYWHFVRCGEDTLTLEVALNTRATASVTSREFVVDNEGKRQTLQNAVAKVREIIERRRNNGYFSGIVLLSRSLIESLPEMDQLKCELLHIVGEAEALSKTLSPKEIEKELKSSGPRELFKRLPRAVQRSLVFKRDKLGRPLLPTDLEAERILGRFVQQEFKNSQGPKRFAPRFHSLELLSSAPLPTPFDCAFGYALGHTAAALICEKRTFYVASCAKLHAPVADWEPCAVPFSFLYPNSAEESSRDLKSSNLGEIPKRSLFARRRLIEVYQHFRNAWVERNVFKNPGPVQFGDGAHIGATHERPLTLLAEHLTLEELKQVIQPVCGLPPPLQLSKHPLLVREERVAENMSSLEQHRLAYKPALPDYLRHPLQAQDEPITPQACDSNEVLAKAFPNTHEHRTALQLVPVESLEFGDDSPQAVSVTQESFAFPAIEECPKVRRVGVVFVSHQAPGFHTIVAGLFDQLEHSSQPFELIGFLGGYSGLIGNNTVTIDKELVARYRNLAGQDMLCQFGDPQSLSNHLDVVINVIRRQNLDGLVVAGDCPHQVDTAFIAEACAEHRLGTRVVGVPISWDCNFPFVQQSVGYHSVCAHLSAHVGNLGTLARACNEMWIFVRHVGDAFSHLAVQVGLQTQANMVLLSGDHLQGQSLNTIVKNLCDLIVGRHTEGHDHGTVVIPWGFLTDVIELRLLFNEIMEIMQNTAYETNWDSIHDIAAKLKGVTASVFEAMPRDVQYEVCFGARERGSRKIDLANISTERLLLRFVEIELNRRLSLGIIEEDFFRGATYPMIFQARSATPTLFDCDLGYTLGWAAGIFVEFGKSGQLVHASGLQRRVKDWQIRGLPLTCLLRAEFDEETSQYRIMPALLSLLRQRSISPPLSSLPRAVDRMPLYQGPVQFWGEVMRSRSVWTTWFMENMPQQDPSTELAEIARLCGELQATMASARAESTLYTVNGLLKNALSVLDSYKHLSDSGRRTVRSLADIPIENSPFTWRLREGPRRPRSREPPMRDRGASATANRDRAPTDPVQ